MLKIITSAIILINGGTLKFIINENAKNIVNNGCVIKIDWIKYIWRLPKRSYIRLEKLKRALDTSPCVNIIIIEAFKLI